MKKLFLYVFLGLILFSHQSFAKVVNKTWQFNCDTRLQDMTAITGMSLIVSIVYEDHGFELKSGKATLVRDSRRYDFNLTNVTGDWTYVDSHGELSSSSAFDRTNTHFWGWGFSAFKERGILKEFEIADYKTNPHIVRLEEYECLK